MSDSVRRLEQTSVEVIPSLLAGAAAMSGSFLVAGFTNQFLGGALANQVLSVMPSFVLGLGIVWLGSLAKPLLVVNAILLGLIGCTLGIELIQRTLDEQSRWMRAAVVFAFLVGFTFLITRSIGSSLGAGCAGMAAIIATEIDAHPGRDVSSVRRRIIRSAGVFVGTLGIGGIVATQRVQRDPASANGMRIPGIDDDRIPELLAIAEDRSFALPDAEPLVSTSFYRVDVNPVQYPIIPPTTWSVRIWGAVERELELTFDQLTSLPTEHRFVTLRCVGEPLNGNKIDNALWTGTPLASILDAAGAGEDCCVGIEAADGYYQAFPRAALERGFLAWGMNGKPLPGQHGAPVRVLIPGHWGEINVKWLQDIEIRTEPAVGYWEAQGWHGTGPVKTVAKLHSVNRDGDQVTIGGPAYAGVRGISRVEVSTDGGTSWNEAELTRPLPGATAVGGTIDTASEADDAWRLWRYSYGNPDAHDVVVRAYDGDGTVQTKEESIAFPSGATGWVTAEIPPA